MRNLDRMSGLILLALGIFIFSKSFEYPFGTIKLPGAAVFPLLASSLLIIISGSIVISSFLKSKGGPSPAVLFSYSKEDLGRVILGIGSLVAYRYLLPSIGFAPSTFLFLFILIKWLGRYSWKISILFSLFTAVVCYYLFQIFLKIPMPRGILGF